MDRGFRGVIFDLDGTLVDSQLDFSAMRSETGCPAGIGLLEYRDTLGSERERKQIDRVIHRHEMAGARVASWMPGARHLLLTLAAMNMHLGVVTRNSRPATELTLDSLGAPPLDIVTREDARPKPHPDGLLQLARHWAIEPAQLAYVGDFRFDIEAAARAGMRSALYLQPDNRDCADRADRVFRHFDELLPWLLGETRSATG